MKPFCFFAVACAVLPGWVQAAKYPYRQLFFDDQRLYVRENLERVYGQPQLVNVYQDKTLIDEYGWVWALDGQDGRVHLMYMGEHKDTHRYVPAAAVGTDGVHFEPRNTAAQSGIEKPDVPNQFLPNPPNGEPGAVLVDPFAPPSERYKMLFCDYAELNTAWRVVDCVYTSPDLVRWTRRDRSCWNTIGTEPMLGAFYNDVHACFSIVSRPDWGQRRVGIVETRDWHAFTEVELCLQPDSLDPALAEIYGMPAFAYEGIFIGFPHIYGGFPQTRGIKFHGGKMHCELAYSLNGRNWQRSLRTPFLEAGDPQIAARMGGKGKMLFLTSLRRDKDGSVLLYGTTTLNEHGSASAKLDPQRCAILIFRLRQDGFIGLKTVDSAGIGRLASRALILKGENLVFNLKAAQATCALYPHASADKPLPGFGHEDCTPFAGDSTCWRPVWKGGNLSAHTGELLVVELKLKEGVVYSFTVDGVPQMEIEAERYRHHLSDGVARPGF